MLAEPNLTAVSGETAKFLAGGEFPVPVSRDRDGNITVEFKQFGVGLSFTPVVLAPGRISLQISTEVSELTNTGAFTSGRRRQRSGLTIPALSVRRTADHGRAAVRRQLRHRRPDAAQHQAGDRRLSRREGHAGAGRAVPQPRFPDDQTELVVLVSAYLVEPTSEAAFAAPTDGFVAPTDPETLLLGRLNAIYKTKRRSSRCRRRPRRPSALSCARRTAMNSATVCFRAAALAPS